MKTARPCSTCTSTAIALLMAFILYTPHAAGTEFRFYAYAEDESGARSDVIASADPQPSYLRWNVIGEPGERRRTGIPTDDFENNFHSHSSRFIGDIDCSINNGQDESVPFFNKNAVSLGRIPGACFHYSLVVPATSQGLPVENYIASPTATLNPDAISFSDSLRRFVLMEDASPNYFFNRWEVQASTDDCSLNYEVRGTVLAIEHRGREPFLDYAEPDPCFPPVTIVAIYTSTQTLFEDDSTPVVSLDLFQDGMGAYAVTKEDGIVTMTAGLQNPASLDTHTFDWDATDNALIRATTVKPKEFKFDPSGLDPGVYTIRLTVTNDRSEKFSSYEFPITVIPGNLFQDRFEPTQN